MMRKDPIHHTLFEFGRLRFYSGTLREVGIHLNRWVSERKKAYVCVTGLHGLSEAQRSPMVLRAHRRATLIVPDGMPLVLVGKALGSRHTERIYGPDIFLLLCSNAEKKAQSIFLYGTTNETLVLLRRVLLGRYPSLRIAGSYAPPMGPLNRRERRVAAGLIQAARPDIVFVGLSTPKQELWMYEMRSLLAAPLLIGVGAAFDFVSGVKPQAPRWVQQSGFEWAYRLVYEPGRLWKRYLVAGYVFIVLLLQRVSRAIIHRP